MPHIVIVPVKPIAFAKSRMSALPAHQRRELAEAFARDTIAAAGDASSVGAVLVVTDDAEFAAALRDEGVVAVPDGADELNATLCQAAHESERRWPGNTPVVVCADLPALRSDELDAVLASAPEDSPAFLRDADGDGTTLYLAPLAAFAPAFGTGSAQRHLDTGAVEIDVPAPSLRRDVDHVGALGQALALGVGPHTTRVTGRDS